MVCIGLEFPSRSSKRDDFLLLPTIHLLYRTASGSFCGMTQSFAMGSSTLGAEASFAFPLKMCARGIGIDILPMPAASWPNACATFARCRKANALARRTLVNFIVAADVSRLKLPPRRNNERTHVRCYENNRRRRGDEAQI
jgi:hypothetical protein